MKLRKQMIIAASIVAFGTVAGVGGYAYYVNHGVKPMELRAEEAAAPGANTEEKTFIIRGNLPDSFRWK